MKYKKKEIEMKNLLNRLMMENSTLFLKMRTKLGTLSIKVKQRYFILNKGNLQILLFSLTVNANVALCDIVPIDAGLSSTTNSSFTTTF